MFSIGKIDLKVSPNLQLRILALQNIEVSQTVEGFWLNREVDQNLEFRITVFQNLNASILALQNIEVSQILKFRIWLPKVLN